MKRWPWLMVVVVFGCEECEESAVCCVEADGTIDADIVTGDPQCGTSSATLVGSESIDPDNPLDTEEAALNGACGDVCCVTGDTRRIQSFTTCRELSGSARRPEDCPADPTADACTCNDAGVVFTIVEGCSGPAFDDATEASFCRSHVEFNLGGDPETQTLSSGSSFGFPDCTVRITCP